VLHTVRRHFISWLLLILAAALLHITFRYWAGNFQGYFTFPVGDNEYGFAHIKTYTMWVSGRGQLTHIPDFLVLFGVLVTLVGVVFAVRRVYRGYVERNDRSAQSLLPEGDTTAAQCFRSIGLSSYIPPG